MFFAVSKKFIWTMVFLIIVFAAAFFGIKFFFQEKRISGLEEELKLNKSGEKAAIFLDLFVRKVLKTDKEIFFEDRLILENAVREINDKDILEKWEQFTAGENEEQIQEGVKVLLEALAKRILR